MCWCRPRRSAGSSTCRCPLGTKLTDGYDHILRRPGIIIVRDSNVETLGAQTSIYRLARQCLAGRDDQPAHVPTHSLRGGTYGANWPTCTPVKRLARM